MKFNDILFRSIFLLFVFMPFGMVAQTNVFPSSGNVGIGLTSPTHKLDVNTGGGNFKTYRYGAEQTVNTTGGWARGFRLRNENNNSTAIFGSLNGSGYISTGFNIGSDPTGYRHQRFTVATNGNVGIGTTSPAHKLDVNTGGGNFKTYLYGAEHTVNTTGGWARSFRLRNERNNSTVAFGAFSGRAYISTGFDILTDPTGRKTQKLTILSGGNVGIGTTSPTHKLDVNTGSGNFKTYKYGAEHTVKTTGGWARGFRLRNENDNSTAIYGSYNGSSYISTGFDVLADPTGYKNQRFTITTSGDVGIGITSPTSKLAVNGTIHSKEVKVDLVGWPDYVFEKEYDLQSLLEVEAFIDNNGHLEGIPNASEVLENGILLGDMNAKLLEKIEELTLHAIRQDKEISALRKMELEHDKLKSELIKIKKALGLE